MNLKLMRPLLVGSDVLIEGSSYKTTEQHGRALVERGYAVMVDAREKVTSTAANIRTTSTRRSRAS